MRLITSTWLSVSTHVAGRGHAWALKELGLERYTSRWNWLDSDRTSGTVRSEGAKQMSETATKSPKVAPENNLDPCEQARSEEARQVASFAQSLKHKEQRNRDPGGLNSLFFGPSLVDEVALEALKQTARSNTHEKCEGRPSKPVSAVGVLRDVMTKKLGEKSGR